MTIKKVLNNNLVLVNDHKLVEKMVLGKGIGFGKKKGDKVDFDKIEKIFVIDSPETRERFVTLVRDIPINHLELATVIIKDAEAELNCQFADSIFLGLTDHLSYAIYRVNEGSTIQNALLWEIKQFYPKEFAAAMKSLKLIEYHEGILLDEHEASFIALHFVNGQQSLSTKSDIIEETKIIQDVMNIVKFHYGIELQDEAVDYSRFVAHIRFFIQRVRLNERKLLNSFLFNQVKEKYPDAFSCVEKVSKYFESKLNCELNDDEMLYFMLHIRRLTEKIIETKSNSNKA